MKCSRNTKQIIYSIITKLDNPKVPSNIALDSGIPYDKISNYLIILEKNSLIVINTDSNVKKIVSRTQKGFEFTKKLIPHMKHQYEINDTYLNKKTNELEMIEHLEKYPLVKPKDATITDSLTFKLKEILQIVEAKRSIIEELELRNI